MIKYFPYLRKLARKFCGCIEYDDVFQELCVHLMQLWVKYDEESKKVEGFEKLIAVALKNKAVELGRNARSRAKYHTTLEETPENYGRRDNYPGLLYLEIEQSSNQEVIEAAKIFLEGYSIEEVSEKMNCSTRTIYRLLQSLKNYL